MTRKYQCVKCGKRYVDWGAEKLGYRCTCSEDAELVPVGSTGAATRKPSLKRNLRSPVAARVPVEESEEFGLNVADEEEGESTEEDEEIATEDGAASDYKETDADEDEEEDEDEDEADEEDATESLSLGEMSSGGSLEELKNMSDNWEE